MHSDAIAKLEALPKPQYRKSAPWPKRPRQQLTKAIAERFAALVSTCEGSLVQLLEAHPELPQYDQLDNWRRAHTWFNDLWKHAQQRRADFLAERCAQLALDATPKTAHVVRVRFDVARWLCSRFHPEIYGDKPLPAQTTVNVGVSIDPQRLNELRSKLSVSRQAFPLPQRTSNDSRTPNNASSASNGETHLASARKALPDRPDKSQ